MSGQELIAIAIVAAAAAWLVRRWRRRGFDDADHGCGGCGASKPRSERALRRP
jgi:hypothetical protein